METENLSSGYLSDVSLVELIEYNGPLDEAICLDVTVFRVVCK